MTLLALKKLAEPLDPALGLSGVWPLPLLSCPHAGSAARKPSDDANKTMALALCMLNLLKVPKQTTKKRHSHRWSLQAIVLSHLFKQCPRQAVSERPAGLRSSLCTPCRRVRVN